MLCREQKTWRMKNRHNKHIAFSLYAFDIGAYELEIHCVCLIRLSLPVFEHRRWAQVRWELFKADIYQRASESLLLTVCNRWHLGLKPFITLNSGCGAQPPLHPAGGGRRIRREEGQRVTDRGRRWKLVSSHFMFCSLLQATTWGRFIQERG